MAKVLNQYGKIYSDPPLRNRIAGRGIVVDDGKILLSYEVNTDVYMTPGGGIEANETLEECCARELKEEAGIIVKPIEHFLTINEYSFDTLYISNYFICQKIGESTQALTQIEIEHGITPVWLTIEEALEIFGRYEEKREDIMSLYLREFTMLNEYMKK